LVPDSPNYLVVRDAEGAPIPPAPGDLGGRPAPGDVAQTPPDFPAAQPLVAGAPLEAIDGLAAAVARIGRGPRVAGVILTGGLVSEDGPLLASVRAQRILENVPDGVVLLDAGDTIRWANARFRQWCGREEVCGVGFLTALGHPEILGPEFSPFHAALASGRISGATLRTADNRYLHLNAAPLLATESSAATDWPAADHVVVSIRDVTHTILEQQKRAAIHQAGQKLADLSPAELADMTIEERIDLLKSNILHYSRDLLLFDVVEIRLLDRKTGRLEPLLAEGMQPEAEARILFARTEHNGVTGYVAATGRSYFCNDTTKDPRYLEGCKGAKSSLTVPLMLHEHVIGTFNVESPEPGGFSHTDMQFLEIFSRDVAAALNTLELLVAEKASTTAESVEAIHGAVALPIDDILNDAVNVMERYIGHDADVVERLQRILRNARDIKQAIQKVGEKMTPSTAHAQHRRGERRRALTGKRILVVDADEQVRAAAHCLLERNGSIVETARDGAEAASMVRAAGDEDYDVILSDIRLPDMSGYQLFLRLSEILVDVPLVLMTGFGYDPGHSIVKARQAGINLVLFKPFRVDQLLDTLERALERPKTGSG
jgi:CheY-like chemotaxis protein/PAS domain-containing protein